MGRLRDNPRLVAIGLGIFWLAVQASLFFFGLPRLGGATPHFKVRLGADSSRYLNAAELLLHGKLPTGKAKRYLGYDLFVSLFLWSGLGKLGIVLAQALITGVAAYCLYRLARRLYDRRTGLLAAFFYIGYAEIHTWNFYILTDSLFVSMVIISLFVVVEWRGLWLSAVAGLVVLFTCTVRPNGFILAASIGTYALYSLWKTRRYKVFMGVACLFLVAFPVAIKLIDAMLVYSPILKHYARGAVMTGRQPSALTMPGIIPEGLTNVKSTLLAITLFIAAKPVYFLQLAGIKLRYFFLHTRPFYSAFHNYFSVLTLVPSYALALWGLFSRTDYPAERVLLISVIFFQSLIVALTLSDWDGRFLLVILPIVFVFASRGAWRLLDAVKALLGIPA
jgi:hypothetical protein